jgi:2-polyprenyl-3-methyl-5-hydroxy-6-metoxy-1,4-benzoquinol methylase
LEENSVENYNKFYGDHDELDYYYNVQKYANDSRLRFFDEVSSYVRGSGIRLDGRDVIDVGCGTGHLLSALGTWATPRTWSGCDFSEKAVEFSRAKFPGIAFFVHDLYDGLSDQYDVVFCTEVLEHLLRPDLALRNLLTATRVGGTLVLTVPNGRIDQLNQHINFWSPESWAVFLERECDGELVQTSTLFDGHCNIGMITVRSER